MRPVPASQHFSRSFLQSTVIGSGRMTLRRLGNEGSGRVFDILHAKVQTGEFNGVTFKCEKLFLFVKRHDSQLSVPTTSSSENIATTLTCRLSDLLPSWAFHMALVTPSNFSRVWITRALGDRGWSLSSQRPGIISLDYDAASEC